MTQETSRPTNRKCRRCGGSVIKYSPNGDFKGYFWYKCEACGNSLKRCICKKKEEQ